MMLLTHMSRRLEQTNKLYMNCLPYRSYLHTRFHLKKDIAIKAFPDPHRSTQQRPVIYDLNYVPQKNVRRYKQKKVHIDETTQQNIKSRSLVNL